MPANGMHLSASATILIRIKRLAHFGVKTSNNVNESTRRTAANPGI